MKNPVSIRLFASACPRNDFYLERVADAAAELGLACTLEKVTDEEEIAANGLTVNCLLSYCPGCRAMHGTMAAGLQPEHCTPALMVNGEVRCYNSPADDETLREILSSYLET